jgi:hypothetical protein
MEDSPSAAGLNREQILAGLSRLNDLLAEASVTGELCLFGGTAMILAFNARISTRDVDAIFHPPELIRKLAGQIADELNLPVDWLNDGVKGFQSARASVTRLDVPQFPNLRIYRPTAEYLLAMKCMAARALDAVSRGDKNDIKILALHLNLDSSEGIIAIVERFFPPERIPAKTQFMIHEVVAELRKERRP